MDERRIFGNKGEALAASFLQKKGMKILDTQQSCRVGEIDLVCDDHGELVFVEVKTRHDKQFGFPEEAVTAHKIKKMIKAIYVYLAKRGLEGKQWRIDVVAIEISKQDECKVVHFENIDTPESL